MGSGSHGEQTGRVMMAFEPLVDELRPDAVVVGDVNSTLACAVVAAKAGCLVAHVEAELRSRDWSMPEEINRVVSDRVGDYLFARLPTPWRTCGPRAFRWTRLLANPERTRSRTVLDSLGLDLGGYVLATLHRPANVDDTATLAGLVKALGTIAVDRPVIFPVHPRTRERMADMAVPAGVRSRGRPRVERGIWRT